jgi:hypothetical protein
MKKYPNHSAIGIKNCVFNFINIGYEWNEWVVSKLDSGSAR